MSMRGFGFVIGAALLLASPTVKAAELKAGPLFVICSATNERVVSNCQAFTEGFVLGLAGAGAICPPPDAYKDVIKDLIRLPRAEIGDKTVAELLVPRLRLRYPCSGV
ncbi:hypothetical protein BHK69_24075 [Bosea vaviloviae]|uniref:Rap1a immunity protein domain-containing protein n=2 Tax=Bosea vaviloviae TaxID=1526658 RepID=A0A1D7U6Z0_9HYPH|nr:hypothetical protein BHK69_24075 [Bosea vaviloviae]